jgi:hypothetical protein
LNLNRYSGFPAIATRDKTFSMLSTENNGSAAALFLVPV